MDRLSCLCKTHENFKFIVDGLFALKLVASNNVDEITETVTCRPNEMSKECSYGQCLIVKVRSIP